MNLTKVGAAMFQQMVREQVAKAGDEVLVVKAAPYIVDKAINKDERTIDFIISDEGVDRDNDTLRLSGWDLSHYKRNPVVLFAHDHWSLPIARSMSLEKDKESGQLRSRAKFIEAELSPFAETVFQFYVNRYLNATSVGFKPTEWEPAPAEETSRKWGLNYLKQELLEYSAVPVPSNPRALSDASKGVTCEDGFCGALTHARAHGLNIHPFKTVWEQALDEKSMLSFMGFDRETIDRMRTTVFGTKTAPVEVHKCGCKDKKDVTDTVRQLESWSCKNTEHVHRTQADAVICEVREDVQALVLRTFDTFSLMTDRTEQLSAATTAALKGLTLEELRAVQVSPEKFASLAEGVIKAMPAPTPEAVEDKDFLSFDAAPSDIGITEETLGAAVARVFGDELRASLNTLIGRVD